MFTNLELVCVYQFLEIGDVKKMLGGPDGTRLCLDCFDTCVCVSFALYLSTKKGALLALL